MKFPKEDFPLIRTAVILLASTVVLGVASIAGSNYLNGLMRHNKFADQKRLTEIRAKLERVREEEQQIRRYHAKYQELAAQGIIGGENRLALIENIARIKEQRKLFGFDYQIAAQQPVQTHAALSQGESESEFGLYGSQMKFSLAVLHEEDWLTALDDLKEYNSGVSLLRECTVTRTGKDDANIASPKLKAECLMIWLSLKPKSGVEPPNPR